MNYDLLDSVSICNQIYLLRPSVDELKYVLISGGHYSEDSINCELVYYK